MLSEVYEPEFENKKAAINVAAKRCVLLFSEYPVSGDFVRKGSKMCVIKHV